MKRMGLLICILVCGISVGMLAACGPKYGYHQDRYYSGYNDSRDAYNTGYRRGYDHGREDRRAGLNFDFDHDPVFRNGISRDSYINDRFRQGYVRGYQDGYGYGRRY
jgi:hypothetical protein